MEKGSEDIVKDQPNGSLNVGSIGKKILHKSMYLGGNLLDLSSDIMIYYPELQEECSDVLSDTKDYLKSVSEQLDTLLVWLDRF